jgi:hypothetical protein
MVAKAERFRGQDWLCWLFLFGISAKTANGSELARPQDAVDRVEGGEHGLADQVATNSPTGASVAGTKPSSGPCRRDP